MATTNKIYQLFNSALMLAIASTYACRLPAEAKKPGWIIRQNSQTYGIVKTTVSPDGIRLEMGDIKVVITSPKWRVTFWNVRTKFSFDESIEDFKKRIPPNYKNAGWKIKIAPAKPYVETFSGVKSKHYRWFSYDPLHPENTELIYDYSCSQEMGLPAQVMEVASICCYVPPGKGFPLRVSSKGNKVMLYTTLLSRTQVDPDIFKLPTGCTKVKSEMEVLLKEQGTVRDEDVSDLYRPFPKH